jgi:hypothetical protein
MLLLPEDGDRWVTGGWSTIGQATSIDLLQAPLVGTAVVPSIPDQSVAVPPANMFLLTKDGSKQVTCGRWARGPATAADVRNSGSADV